MSKTLQQDLVMLGYGDIVGQIDGIIGAKTIKAVRTFQKDLKITVDGIAGHETKGVIIDCKDASGLIGTRNFKIHEFASPDTKGLPKGGMSAELLLNLELLRWKLGNRSVVINSGYRTKAYNKQVGGIAKSNHLTGHAADIKVPGVSAQTVQKHALQIFNGVGSYKNFTHVDTASDRVHYIGKY